MSETVPPSTISALFTEERTFPPPAEFARRANCDASIYEQSATTEAFWAGQADRIAWRKRWDRVLDWSNAPFARWFDGATLNITESCLDQHLAESGEKVAYYWEGEPGDSRTITYRQLHEEVRTAISGCSAGSTTS